MYRHLNELSTLVAIADDKFFLVLPRMGNLLGSATFSSKN